MDGGNLEANVGDDTLDIAASVLEKVLNGSMSSRDATREDVFIEVSNQLETHRKRLCGSRTASLWLQYMHMIDIMRKSIKAERTGNFKMHLESVKDMLPFLAAAGHNHYTKSAWLYLQQMLDLMDTHPDVFDNFSTGRHAIRRTDRFFGGLSYDLIIEQVLMRSLKSNGGLTRGTGMGEHERLVWLLGLPACAEVNAAMQNTTDVSLATSEQHSQHKDVSKARQQRDHNDTTLIVRYLMERNPFNGEPTLRCVASGRAAESSVNADQAKLLGENILHRMIGKNALEITFNRKHQVVTMATKTAVKINGETIQVDPSLLFQRLVKVAEATPTLLASAFCFKLSNIPTSLFDTSGLPRQANKAALAQFIWSTSKQTNSQLPQDVFFVIDGGSLLHQLS